MFIRILMEDALGKRYLHDFKEKITFIKFILNRKLLR